jgi:hypothetical protein
MDQKQAQIGIMSPTQKQLNVKHIVMFKLPVTNPKNNKKMKLNDDEGLVVLELDVAIVVFHAVS